jgi:hypothetical protein
MGEVKHCATDKTDTNVFVEALRGYFDKTTGKK